MSTTFGFSFDKFLILFKGIFLSMRLFSKLSHYLFFSIFLAADWVLSYYFIIIGSEIFFCNLKTLLLERPSSLFDLVLMLSKYWGEDIKDSFWLDLQLLNKASLST